ncbi:MAG TPA: trehalose-phosphatase [Polyangiaceae bacterium]|nr:trehalose-phosphatase [Polyangiaceae bacterium]
MKHLFAAESRDVLPQLAWSRVLLAFDFDGTLAPIVPNHEEAVMRAHTQKLLARVATRYPCAVISGRARQDVERRLERVKIPYVVGNHGIEPAVDMERFRRRAAGALPVLRAELAAFSGVEIEDKKYSLAVHYRKARKKREARAAIGAALARLPYEMRAIPGKLVVNLVPEGAPDKATALLRIRAEARTDIALYVGDDVTDEDVFRLDEPGRLLAVRVGRSKFSAASYFLRDQREIDRLLSTLAGLRDEVSS